ncbi:glycosyl hydrolase family protein [Cryobacterium frigoriphilum]|uniref:Glycosyl hydrolase family protein n=1 Tax=Cryobacterium frigoriphilum TaxID=1259150 RepID=A0A4R9A7E0_9MICO|nr:family 1 glycosylhydrolase [Cryobacterium frigoriphilum]TFD53431.1 glycosyl hydrolase family protein [Cryobacterium frigoriphilum]
MTTHAARDWPHRANELGGSLPAGFLVGVTSSAFQIEGAARDGGRGESVWDVFTSQGGTAASGRIRGGSNASVSSDHLNRYLEDALLLRDLGVDTYAFSLAWPRLQPDARGALNAAGLAFYDRLLDELLAAGIRPQATLCHFDLPAALRGGWMNRDTAGRFGDYAHEVGAALGDRIDSWVTLHEPATVTVAGYALGVHAPGRALLFDALPAAHHQLLGHGLAVQGLRAADVRGGIGLTNAYSPVMSASDRDEDRSYADLVDLLYNRVFADPVLLGRYPDPLEPFAVELRTLLEADPADLRTIHQPLDFYGVSYVQPLRIKAGHPRTALHPVDPDAPAAPVVPGAAARARLPFYAEKLREFAVTGDGASVAPEFLGVALGELQKRYGDALPAVFVTVGASTDEAADARGAGNDPLRIDPLRIDPLRIDYLAEHLTAALAAVRPGGVAAGLDLRGFLVRSILDGFEWEAGFTARYGLVHVAFADSPRVGTRTPKESYRWLQNVLAHR